jgi:hypothetical protein
MVGQRNRASEASKAATDDDWICHVIFRRKPVYTVLKRSKRNILYKRFIQNKRYKLRAFQAKISLEKYLGFCPFRRRFTGPVFPSSTILHTPDIDPRQIPVRLIQRAIGFDGGLS